MAHAEGEIVVAAPLSNAMPLASFENEQLKDGIMRDLGLAIAQRLGRTARFLPVSRNRLNGALADGQADVLCYVMPGWTEQTPLRWSRPLIPNRDLLVARADAPPIKSIAELTDEPIGAVLGYRYPEVERTLGSHFRRDDGPDMHSNLRKLAAGRVRYAIVDQLTLQYETRTTLREFKPGQTLTVSSFVAHCAFSLKGRVPPEELQRSADSLLQDGTVDAILARYR